MADVTEVEVNLTGDYSPKGWTYNNYNSLTNPYSYTYWTTTTNTIYMYQLKCPNCKRMNWCELDKTVTCKCDATLKAVAKKADHEVEVG